MITALTHHWKTPDGYVWLCALASLIGWAPMLILPPMMHGGSFAGEVLTFAGVVVGGYCTLEVIRTRSHLWAKVLWAIWLAPYAAAIVYGLVEAIPYVPRLFAI